jgi:hypothetical protein
MEAGAGAEVVTATATLGEAAMGTLEATVLVRGLRERSFAGIDSLHWTVIQTMLWERTKSDQ